MDKRYSQKNSKRRPSQASTSLNESHPRENRILCQHYMRSLYQVAQSDRILQMLFLGKQKKILGAPLITDPKIIITKHGKRIIFLNLFEKRFIHQSEIIRMRNKTLSDLQQKIRINTQSSNFYKEDNQQINVLRANWDIFIKNFKQEYIEELISSISSNNNLNDGIIETDPKSNILQQSEIITIIDHSQVIPSVNNKKLKIQQQQQLSQREQLSEQELLQAIQDDVIVEYDKKKTKATQR